jgi:FKBP-type peptidyl-prolyl cis-trans isomerase (trigger factor)
MYLYGKRRERLVMKKISVRAICVFLCAIMLLFLLVSCSEEPYDYKLENYIKVSEKWKQIVVSEDEIIARRNKHLSDTLKNTARLEDILGRGAEFGDRVTVSFTFYVFDHSKGIYVEDAVFSDENCLIEIGSGKYPAELETALRGTRKDQPFDVTLMLPLDFKYPSLQGKPEKYSG